MNEWTTWVERGSAFPIILQWKQGPDIPSCLVFSSHRQEMVLSLLPAEWISSCEARAQTCLCLDLGMVISAEPWSLCHPQPTQHLAAYPTTCFRAFPGLRGTSSTLSGTCFPLRHCHWVLFWEKVKEGGGTEPFLPGVEVDGDGMRPSEKTRATFTPSGKVGPRGSLVLPLAYIFAAEGPFCRWWLTALFLG